MNKFVFNMKTERCNTIKICLLISTVFLQFSYMMNAARQLVRQHKVQCKVCRVTKLTFLHNILLNFKSFLTVMYTTVQYCTVLYTTVHYCTLLYTTVHYCTLLYSTVHYCTQWFCPSYSALNCEEFDHVPCNSLVQIVPDIISVNKFDSCTNNSHSNKFLTHIL
jgi:hypothetical protein